MTLLHADYCTYVMPTEPRQCGVCGSMSGIFINRFGKTSCVRCDVGERSIPVERKVAA